MNTAVKYDVTDLPVGGLEGVSAAAAALVAAQAEKARLEVLVAVQSAAIKKIEEETLPMAMEAIGMKEFTLFDGSKVKVAEEVHAGITEVNEASAFAWLRATNNDSVIKHALSVVFGKGEDELAATVKESIIELAPDAQVNDKEFVHPATLKSFVKERVELEKPNDEGEVTVPVAQLLPRDVFGVWIINRATLKRKK